MATAAIGPFDGNNNNDGDKSIDTAFNNLSIRPADKIESSATVNSVKRRDARNRSRDLAYRKSLPAACFKKKPLLPESDGFEVYNVDSAVCKTDYWESMEAYLQAAQDTEKKRRNDREEIRRRLAMGAEQEEDVPKANFQTQLRSALGMSIETDDESDPPEATSSSSAGPSGYVSLPVACKADNVARTQTHSQEFNLFLEQGKLQAEARMALSQAKELARIQMQVERQQRKRGVVSDLVRQNLDKLGLPFSWDCRRLSRKMLTELNVSQLQLIVNDLHSQIEKLNEELVERLMQRDELHMEQDSMLVDVEDLTRYLTAKQQSLLECKVNTSSSNEGGHSSMPLPAVNQKLSLANKRLRYFNISRLRK